MLEIQLPNDIEAHLENLDNQYLVLIEYIMPLAEYSQPVCHYNVISY